MQELLEKKALTPEEIYARIDKVSANDVLSVAKEIFKPKNLNMALVGPFKDNKKFLEILWKKKNY